MNHRYALALVSAVAMFATACTQEAVSSEDVQSTETRDDQSSEGAKDEKAPAPATGTVAIQRQMTGDE